MSYKEMTPFGKTAVKILAAVALMFSGWVGMSLINHGQAIASNEVTAHHIDARLERIERKLSDIERLLRQGGNHYD